MQMLIFSLAELPASPSRSRASGLDLLTREATSASPILQSLTAIAPNGFSGRTSLASCPQGTDGILEPSSERWGNSGMGSPTECWTLSTCEWTGLNELSLSDEGVCSLSDVLEAGDVPPHLYLSQDACQKIILRAEQHGLIIPEHALEALVQQSTR